MDKIILLFMADMLYIKGVLCYEEYEDIANVKDFNDLDTIVDKMLRSGYNGYKKGNPYATTE